MRIGSAWIKTTDNGVYLSVSIDAAALPLTLTEDKYLTLWEIPEVERKTENAPHYAVVLSKPKAKEDK